MKTLLVYYHPVVLDIAQTFEKLGHEVFVAVNPTIKDNYGTGADIIEKYKKQYKFPILPLSLATIGIKNRGYDLVGCDGVFDGDVQIMNACRDKSVPLFNIQGYPNVIDEPADNILSLGWFTPTVQYNQKYPSEGHKKQIDWQNISNNGRSDMKNMCAFYPNFWNLKEEVFNCDYPYIPGGFVSLIQGYEKWNKFSYDTFIKVRDKLRSYPGAKSLRLDNLEGKSHEEVFDSMIKSRGLLHLKWADAPGIALFEAMLVGLPVLTLSSFVYASMNQEVLIDHYNAIVADSVEELCEQMRPSNYDVLWNLGKRAKEHSYMLTDFDRQKHKLENFIDRCLNVNQ